MHACLPTVVTHAVVHASAASNAIVVDDATAAKGNADADDTCYAVVASV